jgi:CDP-glucose 4,6-dehydratase
VKAALTGATVDIRNPRSVRPWQHVLEPLWGYLLLSARLLEGERDAAEGWNFGPDADSAVEVMDFVGAFQAAWGGKPDVR